jgi:hypothetical protein
MFSKRCLRRRLLVDYRVQGALIVRVVLYWLLCLGTMALVLLAWSMISVANRPLNARLAELWEQYGLAAVASLLLLPVVVLDLLQLSNRFVGPIFRLRRSMHNLAQGAAVEAIHFRQGDFWQEFADDFNVVAEKVEHARNSTSNDGASDEGSATQPLELSRN